MCAQLSLRREGKTGFSGNIWSQQFASKAKNVLQYAASTFSNFPEKNDLEISSTHPWTLKRDNQHFTISTGEPEGKSPGIAGGVALEVLLEW